MLVITFMVVFVYLDFTLHCRSVFVYNSFGSENKSSYLGIQQK